MEKYDTTLITRYVSDASGNVMGIYNDTTVMELPIYGSSRAGVYRGEVLEGDQTLGRRSYELSNHLGNVSSVITDNIGMTEGDSTWAYVTSTSDYYPFGLDMQERSWKDTTALAVRYGFNGKEKDSGEEWGQTNYDYGFRIYNPTIAKFLSVDPLTASYPMLTPYQFASNRPIDGIDLEGLEYLSSEDARVEFKAGRLQLKVENFHNINYNAWQRANGDPKNWKKGEIGLDRTVANLTVITPNNAPQADAIPGDDLPNNSKSQFDDGIESANGITKVPATKGAKALGKGGAVLDFIVFAGEQYMSWAWNDDSDKINEHSDIARRIEIDIEEAINQGMIPEQYQNQADIANIMNVILQGVNNTDNPEIYDIGMTIYNSISQPFEIKNSSNAPGADATRVNQTYKVPKKEASEPKKKN